MYERTLKKQKNSFFFIDTCEIYNNKYIYIYQVKEVCANGKQSLGSQIKDRRRV